MTNKTNIIGIGKALYKDGTQIRVSKPDDWGWFYDSLKKDEGTNEDRVFFVIKVVRKWGRWKAILQASENVKNIEIQDNEEFQPDKENGLLYSFHAKITNQKDEETDIILDNSNRISLRYYRNQKNNPDKAQLISESGYYPSLYFFMLGATSCGKTCWNYALNTDEVRKNVEKLHDKVQYYEDQPARATKFKPTQHTDVKFNTCIYLENDDKKALAFIVDLAGEVANVGNNDQNILRLRDSIRRYAAGIFVVRNKSWLFNEDWNRGTDPRKLISLLKKKILKDKFCYILTSADEIKRTIEEEPEKGKKFSLTPDSPIFYPINYDTDKEKQMYENWAITSYIIQQRDSNNATNSPCFTVSSGCENGQDFDCSLGYNAELPLVYMLKSLVKI